MPLPAVFANCTLRYGVPTKELQMNVLWFTVSGTIGGANDQDDANTIATSVGGFFNDALGNVLTEETEMHGVHVTYDNAGNVFAAGQPFASLNGAVAVDTLPEYCATVIQKRTAHGGRRGRGRWYFGCVPETFADNGTLTIVASGLYDALSELLHQEIDCGGASLRPFMYSKADNQPYDVISCRVDQELGTLRRRKIRPLL